MKTIMILGASILQLPAIKKALSMGLKVIVVDMNPSAIGFFEKGVIKEEISTIDIESVLFAAKKHNIDGIMTLASDMPIRTVARVASELNLVGVDELTALKATNKAVMRECLRDNHVPIPSFFRVKSYDDFIKAANTINNKFIVKPVDNSGSRGIYLVKKYRDNTALKSAFDYSKKYSRNGELLVEEYMSGPEVSVETISINGICHVIQITDKITTGSPFFVEMGHTQPSNLSDNLKKKIEKIAIAANAAIGIVNGPSHTEIIVTENGPKIVEIGARLGGDCITTHLVPLSTGIDMVEACIKIALKEIPIIKKTYNKISAIRYFNQSRGVLDKIIGIDEAKKIKGVYCIEFVKGKGEFVDEINNSASRIGFAVIYGDSYNEINEIWNKICKTIKIVTKGV